MATTFFTGGDDDFTVRENGDYLLIFLEGNDRLKVLAGNVVAMMGEGDDFAEIRLGAATVYGESGADRFNLYADNSTIHGGGGNDSVFIRGGMGLQSFGGEGDDRFEFLVAYGTTALHGGAGNDSFFGNAHVVDGTIDGDEGDDYFAGFRYEVQVRGGVGNDTYRALPGTLGDFVELAGEGTDVVQPGAATSPCPKISKTSSSRDLPEASKPLPRR